MIFAEIAFEKYFRNYLKDKGITTRALIENAYNGVLEEWKTKPSLDLGGDTPGVFFEKIYKNGRFADYIVGVFEQNLKIGDITAEFLASLVDRVNILKEIFEKDNEKARLFAVEMLSRESQDDTTEFLADILFDYAKYGDAVTDGVFDALKDGRHGLDGLILKKTDNLKTVTDAALKDMLLDILSGYGANTVVRGLVTEGLLAGGDVMLYANLLGRCGGEESIAVLREYAKSRETSELEYMEIRNAVERLGGLLDI
ncbi:MAG: hypothetical protein LBT30_00715 [Clostridiales bacterium]|jgi:hypothetical protein|nr:hypothetical protein [Clostridiales bacterium]